MGECLITRRGGEAYELPVLNSAYPANVTVVEAANASASFSVQITTPGKPAEYTYQWYLNGAKISGATNAGYTKIGLTAAGTHTLYCVVTNKAGTVTSRVATLTVRSSQPAYTYTGSHTLTKEGTYNWKLTLKTSGMLKFTRLGTGAGSVQVFCVGGGGGDGNVNYPGPQCGGGGGYTKTVACAPQINTSYQVIIGGGGGRGAAGGATSVFGVSSAGGNPGNGGDGGAGGSGGGGYLRNGGSNGGSGGTNGDHIGGAGQGYSTRAFGEGSGELYSPGGGGGEAGGHVSGPGAGLQGQNSGAGGSSYGAGASGIVIIRNAR